MYVFGGQLVNIYVGLVNERSARNGAPVLALISQFFAKLCMVQVGTTDKFVYSYNYDNVSRWLGKMGVDIFSLQRVLVPVNCGNMHWCFVLICITEVRNMHASCFLSCL